MQEDPSARRNRGNAVGLWIVAALAGLVVILITVEVLRPAPTSVAPPPEIAPVSVKQRVANDQAAAARREASRPQP